jgi:NAD(P)-dependent dehydrogenase (short-subunit alcohol dehydrogenase family)
MTKYFLERKLPLLQRYRKTKNTAAELETETGGTCLPIQCDVRHYEEVENMLQEVLKTFGKVDVLLNNAAGNFISPTERLSANAFDTVIDIVLKGSKTVRLLGKHWLTPNKIIYHFEYCYDLRGRVLLTWCLVLLQKLEFSHDTKSCVEWAKYGIRSNAIALDHSQLKALGTDCYQEFSRKI